MSTCLLPTISVSTEPISISAQSNQETNSRTANTIADTINGAISIDNTSQTAKLSRNFLDSKNASLFAKTRLISLKVKKIRLDQEILRYHDMLLQYKDVKGLETLCDMYKEHLTNLLREFLDVTQEITLINQLG